jgi:hypothetical protein
MALCALREGYQGSGRTPGHRPVGHYPFGFRIGGQWHYSKVNSQMINDEGGGIP